MSLWRRLRGVWRQRLASWVRRRQGVDALPVEIRRQRLYILPTRAGLGLGVLLLFMLLAGLNYGNNLALLATFMLMGFVLIGMNLCHRNLQGLRIVAASTRPGFAEGHGYLDLTLEGCRDPDRWAIAVAAESQQSAQASVPHIARNSSVRVEIAIATPRRGLQSIDRFELSTTFPFGLFRAWTWVHLPLAITVYPAATGTRPLPLGRDSQDTGASNTALGSDEWSGIRPFRDGDSPRQVIWTAYARELPLLVKEHAGAAAEWLSLDFEALPGLDGETRLRQICRWILEADQRGARYALSIPGRRYPPDCSAAHRQSCLTALAQWQSGAVVP